MPNQARKKVVILGGGIAGMSAAHELIERGFQVEVFERKPVPGGKARSIPASGPSLGLSPFGSQNRRERQTSRGPDLPGEHGFRFFPGFYKHIVDTMDRIPCRGGSVAQNLVAAEQVLMAPFDRAPFALPARFPESASDLQLAALAVVEALTGELGVPLDEGVFFGTKLWQFLTSCEERRLVEYERTNWWDFIEADSRSEPYRRYFGNGVTRSLVAAKARRASAKTIGGIFTQIVMDILTPGVAADRLLNGPTNDVWINPWLRYLEERGVVYHRDAFVSEIHSARGAVRSVSIQQGSGLKQVTADYFIGALPVERMAELLQPDLLRSDPSLVNLHALTEYVEWMVGIQFYLTEDVPLCRGHVIHVDTPWALTSVSQAQFWRDIDLSRHGDGNVRGVLSVDISDWDVEGFNGKQAQNCSRPEIAAEVWEQLKKSLNFERQRLRDDQLHSWFLDPGIDDRDADADPATPRVDTNLEPLLVNYVDTWRLRPEAVTRIGNFFLASDYVRTFTDLATMEAANEAARRAVNGVLRAAGSDAPACEIWNLHEPEIFLPLRAHDRVRYRKGLAWDGEAVGLVRSVLGSRTNAPAALRPSDTSGAAAPPSRIPVSSTSEVRAERAAAQARSSSESGLHRLRLVRPSV
jgi:uncharacterized protein with NAD-binding domain and iron-sulfur cluster